MKIADLIPDYLCHLKALGRSVRTIQGAGYDLRPFRRFLEQERVFDLDQLSADVMAEYQQELAFKLSVRGSLLSLRSQGQLLSAAKDLTRFLKQKDYLLNDPGESIKLPRKPRTLPRAILTPEQVKQLLDAPDMQTNAGYRNRVIIEILYDTAIRRSELVAICLQDLDLITGFIRIQGKGGKERVVPLSQKVGALVRNYILAVRPAYVQGADPGYLILNRWGKPMAGNGIWEVVKKCAGLAGITKNVTPHGLRHSCATHMLKNGAPVRHLQQMLGHESLESTQIYTHVTINDLKQIHAKYHPSETLAKGG